MKFTITWNNVTYEVEVEETEKPGQLRVKVAGVEHLVDVVQKKNPGRQPHKPQTPRPQPTPAPSAGGVVSAPLPGVVLSLPVKVSDKVPPERHHLRHRGDEDGDPDPGGASGDRGRGDGLGG